jgi:hypothetical protein
MSKEKRPVPVESAPLPEQPSSPAPEETESDFFASDEEHDGWSAIVKRRPPEEPAG